jgi:hypothetical protein
MTPVQNNFTSATDEQNSFQNILDIIAAKMLTAPASFAK